MPRTRILWRRGRNLVNFRIGRRALAFTTTGDSGLRSGGPAAMINEPPMEKGLSLGLALRKWTHPRLITKLDDLEQEAAEQPRNLQLKEEAKKFRAKLELDFINSLLVGRNQFSLTGYLDPITPISNRGWF